MVLAVECNVHFSSRMEFLLEAHRILRQGGKLVLSDFVSMHATGMVVVLEDAVWRRGE